MIGYLLLLHVLGVMVQARPSDIGEMIMTNLVENDANLNPGFDINAYRLNQLNLHNYYRSLHGVPAMTRNAELEAEAQAYAEVLAAKNQGLNHCHDTSCNSLHAGENLADAWGSTSAESNATRDWYNEIWDYNYCNDEVNFKRPGHESKHIGHFTQVVWKASVQLGIGYARTADRKRVYVVGRYLKAGNVQGQYTKNVLIADYLFNTFQNNCGGYNGGFSAWSQPGKCTQSCGGGIRFQSRTCTKPKPSLNGADCQGKTEQLAAREWCNIESCPGNKNHRDKQCETRGHPAKSYILGSHECILFCLSNTVQNFYDPAGRVDDGTHCRSDSGVCVEGECTTMPKYVAPTQPPPTNAAGSITGSYTGTPSKNFWNNIILTVPNGTSNVVITNKNYNAVSIKVGYTGPNPGSKSYQFAESSWMTRWINYYNRPYKQTKTIVGVTFTYERTKTISTITIAGPVQPTGGRKLVLFVQGSSAADISWTYDA